MKWEKVGDEKQELIGKGFKIVYSADIQSAVNDIAKMTGGEIKMEELQEGKEMTAVVVEGKNRFYVLKGDYRKHYEKVFKDGLLACVNIYNRNKGKNNENVSLFSTDPINNTPERMKEKTEKINKAIIHNPDLNVVDKISEVISKLKEIQGVKVEGASGLNELLSKLKEVRGLGHSSKLKVDKHNRDEVAKKIKEITGAGSFILLMNDAIIPCQEESCDGHNSSIMVEGVRTDYVEGILEQTIKEIKKDN